MLQIYNTLTQEKAVFKPLIEGKVGFYVCGMTVYDYCHVGHARVFVVFDMIVRYLRYLDYDVHYVRNITDIDDKIIVRANERGVDFRELTTEFIDYMHEDELMLGAGLPDEEPQATDYMDEMVAMIETLIAKGAAYHGESGDVYFSVKSCAHYGELVRQNVEQLRVGARVDIVEAKADPLDFVLWKLAKPGEPAWPSPWGEGRPGWHIECSAMSTSCLGKQFDLHGGGIDLRFPHHQNEVAQSDTAHDCQAVQSWLHVGHVQVNDEKMSKSLGNFFTIRDVVQQYRAEVIRYFMLASHYRSPVNYSQDNLKSAQQALTRFYLALRDVTLVEPDELLDGDFDKRFHVAMNDDFNTPEALAVLFDLTRHINKLVLQGEESSAGQHAGLLKHLAGVLGFLQDDPQKFLQAELQEVVDDEVMALISQREQARVDGEWARADAIRDQLLAMNIVLEDSDQGTKWRKRSVSE
jgi:cysteinyl-tRNA synthetase